MRSRVRRLLGASALALLVGLGGAGCSGGQQDDQGLETSDDQQANNNAAGDGNAADSSGGEKDADAGNAAPSEGGNAEAEGGGGEKAAEAGGGGNASENDLQEIITEMNGQKGGDAAATPAKADAPDAQALQADAAQPAAPAAQPVNQASAAPAAKADNQPAAPAASSAPTPFQPGGTPAAAGLPELGSKMAYIVEKGDTLARISQKIYGQAGRWQELATLSGITNPSRIFPGDLVYYTLDEGGVAFAKAYETIQRSEEQVKPGDTLATIAQRLYGTTLAWRSIWRHNDKIDNPDVVTPGTTVYYVPKGALQAAVHKVKAAQFKIAANTKIGHKTAKHHTFGKIIVKTKVGGKAQLSTQAHVPNVKSAHLAGSQIHKVHSHMASGNVI